MQNSSATLLGLPSELRLSIYDHVFQQQLNVRPIDGFRLERHYPPSPHGLQGSFVRVTDVSTQQENFVIPWLNLTLSCKAVAQEIQQHLESPSFLHLDINYTFELDLTPATGVETNSLIVAAWRRIPCPPQGMRKLVIHNNGAAAAIIPALNLFLHCGINMDRKRPLTEHLTLDDLVVNVLSPRALAVPEQIDGFEPVDEHARSKPEFEHTHAVLSNYHRMGKLSGYLRKVRVCGGGKTDEFQVVQEFRAGFDSFRWGVAT